MSSCSSLYRDTNYGSECSEFATVDEMNGITGAVPIPASTAQRIYQTPSTVNTQGQVVNPEVEKAVKNLSNATGVPSSTLKQFIRMNRGF